LQALGGHSGTQNIGISGARWGLDGELDLRAHSKRAGALLSEIEAGGLSNPEIGARLFISPRTVQYYPSKVFTKLCISSRGQLHRVLPSDPDRHAPLTPPTDGPSKRMGRSRPALQVAESRHKQVRRLWRNSSRMRAF
jgi:DNA-binding CsgD family transcriptional regulator